MILTNFFSNVPNLLTSLRIILIFPFIWLHYQEYYLWAMAVGGIAFITDFLDGFLARKLNQETDFGAIWDPIADKIITQVFYTYAFCQELIPWYFFVIVFLRNFSQMLSVPILVWWLKRKFYVKSKKLPKLITTFTFLYFFLPVFFSKFLSNKFIFFTGMVMTLGELQILLTYVPRLIQIATDKHDTFE